MAKTNFKPAKAQLAKFKRAASKKLKAEYKEQILFEIAAGRSPVKGFGRFKKYSTSYLKAIKDGRYKKHGKSKRPVNLNLSGKLIKSLKVTGFDKLRIIFDNKLADIHNKQGAGKSKTIRRMLPTKKGEQFNRSIQLRVREVLNRIAKNIFR